MRYLINYCFVSPQGAATTVWACLNPYVDSAKATPDGLLPINGAYLMDCAPALPSVPAAIDESKQLRKALWKITEQQLNEALESSKGSAVGDSK